MVTEPKVLEAYEYGEKRFVDFRLREEKAYLMYLWAANVLETQCNLHPSQCTQPPRPIKDFRDDWHRYKMQQVAAFNSAVDWMLLSYSTYRMGSSPNFLVATRGADVMQRANYLTPRCSATERDCGDASCRRGTRGMARCT